MSLSDKAKEWYCAQAELDVKEFIKKLKEGIIKITEGDGKVHSLILEGLIDKLAGEDLK